MLALLIAFLIVAPAGWLLVRQSTWLLDYAIWVYALNRFVRRLVDWKAGAFNPFNPISLTPLFVAGLLFFALVMNWQRLSRPVQTIFVLFYVAIGYGMAVGLVMNGPATLYAGADYLAPVFVLGFAATMVANRETGERWVRTSVWAAIVVAAYGWYQYFTIPAWDAFWVQSVGFVGYLGQLVPTQMTVFSTMGERGPFAGLLAFVGIAMVVVPRWRTRLGWIGVLLVLSSMLLALSRASVILVALGILLHPVISGGRSLGKVMIMGIVGLFAVLYLLPLLPGAERLTQRFETLQSLDTDGSYLGRLDIFQHGAELAMENPIGYGIGSSGLATRITAGASGPDAGLVGDNGYLELLTSLGWIGFSALMAAFFAIWLYCRDLVRLGVRSDFLSLGMTYLVVLAVAMMVGNFFSGISLMWVVMGRLLSPDLLVKKSESASLKQAIRPQVPLPTPI